MRSLALAALALPLFASADVILSNNGTVTPTGAGSSEVFTPSTNVYTPSSSINTPSSSIINTPSDTIVSVPSDTVVNTPSDTIVNTPSSVIVNTPVTTNTPVQSTESSNIVPQSTTPSSSSGWLPNAGSTASTFSTFVSSEVASSPASSVINTVPTLSDGTTTPVVSSTTVVDTTPAVSTPSAIESVTSTEADSGTTATVSVTESASSATITEAPATTTVTGAAATSSVSSVSSDIIALIPIIKSWTDDTSLKTDTLNKVEGVKSEVESVISELGGSSSSGCDSKRRRGLLSPISDIINTLSCIGQELDDITDSINLDDVTAVESTVTTLTSETEDLTDDDDDNKSNSQSDSSETSATSSSESTCTEDTAQHVTAYCEPTSYTSDGTLVTSTTCYSSATFTITGCDVTEVTTTITGTATDADQTPCASDTCGDSCPMEAGVLSGASMSVVSTEDCAELTTITTDTLPTASYGTIGDVGIASPTAETTLDSAAKRDWLPNSGRSLENQPLAKRALSDVSPPYSDYVKTLSPVAWVSQNGDASGMWFPYPTFGHGRAGVNGIYGCTAVIIASEKGVYISHIWENPVFITGADWTFTSDDSFNTNAFEALRDGNDYALSVTGLVGTDDNPGVLHAIYAPKVFVLTPFTTDWDRTTKGITTKFRYQARAESLAQKLADVIPGSGGEGYVLGYTRTSQQASTQEPGVAGRAILEVDPFQSWLTTPNDPTSAGLQVGRWRLWVEDQLITYQDFWLPNTTPTNTKRRRDAAAACSLGDSTESSTGTATAASTEVSRSSTPGSTDDTAATSTPGASSVSSEAGVSTTPGSTQETAVTSTPGTTEETTFTSDATETPVSTGSLSSSVIVSSTIIVQTTVNGTDISTPGSASTPSTFVTSTRAGDSSTVDATTTSGEDETTTAVETSTYTGTPLCVNHGGPNVATPYCECSTTTAGQTFFASASLISLHCTDYTTFPSAITLSTAALTTEAPDPTPFVTTKSDGEVLSYTDLTVQYAAVDGSIQITYTNGVGDPVTLTPPSATETAGNNKGSSQCHSIDDACDRAVAQFDDDTIYYSYTAYISRIKSGIIVAATFGQAGCIAYMKCDDYTDGMSGAQIKEAVQNMKDNDDVKKCGTTYLSNTCHITTNYCTSCNAVHP